MKKTIILALAFIALLGGGVFAYNALKDNVALPEAPEAGQSAENEDERIAYVDINLKDREGNAVALSDFIGKPIVLNFWASWCPPCKEEMPEFEKLYLECGDDVQFLMVDLVDGQQETVEIGAAYADGQGFTFPVYFDVSNEAAIKYGVRGIPATLFIDKDGYIVTGAQGALTEKALRTGIEMIRE